MKNLNRVRKDDSSSSSPSQAKSPVRPAPFKVPVQPANENQFEDQMFDKMWRAAAPAGGAGFALMAVVEQYNDVRDLPCGAGLLRLSKVRCLLQGGSHLAAVVAAIEQIESGVRGMNELETYDYDRCADEGLVFGLIALREYWKQQCAQRFDDGVSSFRGMLELIRHNPKTQKFSAALRAIVEGEEQLNHMYAQALSLKFKRSEGSAA
jgi:hypothetical protein